MILVLKFDYQSILLPADASKISRMSDSEDPDQTPFCGVWSVFIMFALASPSLYLG